MSRTLTTILIGAFMLAVASNSVFAQSVQVADDVRDGVVSILIDDGSQPRAVGSGLVVRSDGLILTAYDLVRDARKIAVRLRNGESFDRAELVVSDEARNLAVLRINAVGLSAVRNPMIEEALVGSPIILIANGDGATQPATSGFLTAVTLADDIPGAGKGFRVLRFNAQLPAHAGGAVLLDERGRVLGLVTASPQSQVQNYAIPITGATGLIRSVGGPVSALAAPVTSAPAFRPTPIPQSSVMVPQRPVLPLEARGPGSVVVKPSRPVDILLASKTIYVASETEFFKPEHLVNSLRKRTELEQWGLTFVDDPRVADLVLSLDHVLFTYKFTFSLAHQRTGVIVATGNVIVFDGNLGGDRMADRVIQKIAAVRAQAATK